MLEPSLQTGASETKSNKLSRYFGANTLGARNWLTIASILFIGLFFLLGSVTLMALLAPAILFGLQIAVAVLFGFALSAALFCGIVGAVQDYLEFKKNGSGSKSYFSFLFKKFTDWISENPLTAYCVIPASATVVMILLSFILLVSTGGISLMGLLGVVAFCFIFIILTEAICRGCGAIKDYFFPGASHTITEQDQSNYTFQAYTTTNGREMTWFNTSDGYQKHTAIINVEKIINSMEFIVLGDLSPNLKTQWKITYDTQNSSLSLSTYYSFSYQNDSSKLTEFIFTQQELKFLFTIEQLDQIKNLERLSNNTMLPQQNLRLILSNKKIAAALETKISNLNTFSVEILFDPKKQKIAFDANEVDSNLCEWLKLEKFQELYQPGQCLHRFFKIEPPITKDNLFNKKLKTQTVVEVVEVEEVKAVKEQIL